MQTQKACTSEVSGDQQREVSKAFKGGHLHLTPKHVLSRECLEERLHPSFTLHRGCPHPHPVPTHILEK